MIEKILLENYYKYPLMQAQDFFKLLYQGEFGGAHACADSQKSILSQIKNELKHIDAPLISSGLTETISASQLRVNLPVFYSKNLNLDTLSEMFLVSAKASSGTMENLTKKIVVFETLVKDKLILLPYVSAKSASIKYLTDAKPLSHSITYKLNYNPHYRVVRRDFFDMFPVIDRINSILRKKIITVAIDGNSGSGKTFYAEALRKYYAEKCNVFHADDFFLPASMRTSARLSQIGGNIHYERLYKLFEDISKGKSVNYKKYNCETDTFTEESAEPRQINIVEGVYSASNGLAEKYDIIVKLCANGVTQQKRLLSRSGEEILKKYKGIWLPLENKYFENSNFANAITIRTDDKDIHSRDF